MADDPSQTKPKLRADAERNRQRLLSAAMEVFAERGIDVTLDDIARHAGVGVGTAYRRFANKDELIDALFEQRIEAMAAVAEEAAQAPTGWDGLVLFLNAAMEMQVADRGLAQVMFSVNQAQHRVAKARARIAPRVGRLVARAQEEGSVRADLDPLDIPVINLMVGIVVDLGRSSAPDLWQRILGIVLDGLRAERSAPTPLPVRSLTPETWEASLMTWRPR